MVEPSVSERIRALRDDKESVDPWRPIAVIEEAERQPGGGLADCLTVFLAGAECPFTCRFCDLWRRTLDHPTPRGALTAQLETAIASATRGTDGTHLKLYNASNFFEPRAVPVADRRRLAALAAPFARVVVECHPRLLGPPAAEFAAALEGRLEVAVGLETVHPGVLGRLNKRMTVDDFDAAAAFLVRHEIDLRTFVLIGVPWLEPAEARRWTVASVTHALERGARVVTLIPLRGGNGELDRLAAGGSFCEPSLADIEAAFERSVALPPPGHEAVVLLDLWDLERFAACPECRRRRLRRLRRINARGEREAPISCPRCEADER